VSVRKFVNDTYYWIRVRGEWHVGKFWDNAGDYDGEDFDDEHDGEPGFWAVGWRSPYYFDDIDEIGPLIGTKPKPEDEGQGG
jgi:hypothetical protein